VHIAFKWFDAFRPTRALEQSSIHYEKAAVLFNLGAVMTQQALGYDRTTDAGIKEAAKKFQARSLASVFGQGRTVGLGGSHFTYPPPPLPPTQTQKHNLQTRIPLSRFHLVSTMVFLVSFHPRCRWPCHRRRRGCGPCCGTAPVSRWSSRAPSTSPRSAPPCWRSSAWPRRRSAPSRRRARTPRSLPSLRGPPPLPSPKPNPLLFPCKC